MKRAIVFLIRRRFGLKANEFFAFKNQKTHDVYFFTDTALIKYFYTPGIGWRTTKSGVSLNWLLDDECKIERVDFNKEELNEN